MTLTTALIAHPATDGWLEPSLVQATVRKRLAERGWITPGGNTRLVGAATDYLRHCEALRMVPELQSLPATLESAKLQLGCSV